MRTATSSSISDTDEASARLGAWALGRWKLEEVLGAGGMSTVYGGVHRTNGKRVAVKVLHPHLRSLPESVERFLGEGYVANQVDHPGAVSVFDDGTTDDGALCLVMDKLVGGSLNQWLARRGALPLFESLLVIDRLLDVLAAAHRAGVVHRDVKPDNIFVTMHGEVKLLDFGIARAVESSCDTQAGSVMGTPAYMPSEQAEGRWNEVDARADVFAAGAVAIALIAGEAPRYGETPNLTLLAAMSVPLEGARARGLEVPAAVADVIDRAVAWRREDRYPSADAMAVALRAAWLLSTGTRLEGHDNHLAPIGRLLQAPARDSGVARKLDADSTDAMPAMTHTLLTSVAPSAPAVPPRQRVAWHAPPRDVLIGSMVAALVVAMLTGIVIACMVPSSPPETETNRAPRLQETMSRGYQAAVVTRKKA